MGTVSCLAHSSPKNVSAAAKNMWKKLKLNVSAGRARVSTESSDNQLTEPIRRKIEGLPGQTLRELLRDYFEVNHTNLSLLVDLNNYIDKIISIIDSIKEHDELTVINLPVEKIDEFMKARDPFPPLSESPLSEQRRDPFPPLSESPLSEQRIKIGQRIQVLKGKVDSKTKGLQFWRKLTRVVSWLILIHPAFAPIANFSYIISQRLEERMLAFWNEREAKLKETIKVVDVIASVLERPPVSGSIEKFAKEVVELKRLFDQLIQAKSAEKGVEDFQKRVVEIKEEVEKWHAFTYQARKDVVSSLG